MRVERDRFLGQIRKVTSVFVSRKSRSFYYLLAGSLCFIVVYGAVMICGTGLCWEQRGQFGDMFGALNALFSGLAFFAIYMTFVSERKDQTEARIYNMIDRIEDRREWLFYYNLDKIKLTGRFVILEMFYDLRRIKGHFEKLEEKSEYASAIFRLFSTTSGYWNFLLYFTDTVYRNDPDNFNLFKNVVFDSCEVEILYEYVRSKHCPIELKPVMNACFDAEADYIKENTQALDRSET